LPGESVQGVVDRQQEAMLKSLQVITNLSKFSLLLN